MAFQTDAFQNNAFQIISRVKQRPDYEKVFLQDDEDKLKQRRRHRRRLEILAQEAFQKELDQLAQDELDFLDLLIVMLAEESTEWSQEL